MEEVSEDQHSHITVFYMTPLLSQALPYTFSAWHKHPGYATA
jgi:hypothetical protein